MLKIIACLGDSNTYGYDPHAFPASRYPPNVRWTARLNVTSLWKIVNLGINGRSLPRSYHEISSIVNAIYDFSPSLVCVMLGTNDLLCGTPPDTAAERLDRLLSGLLSAFVPESLLVLAPPLLSSGTWVDGPDLIAASEKYALLCENIAKKNMLRFCNTGKWNVPLSYDGVHFTEEGHIIFSEHMAALFENIFC